MYNPDLYVYTIHLTANQIWTLLRVTEDVYQQSQYDDVTKEIIRRIRQKFDKLHRQAVRDSEEYL